MKRMIVKNWMAALLLTGACCGLVACSDNNDDDSTPPPAPADVTAVIGAYDGTMAIFQVVPNESEGEQPTGTQVEATVTGDAIQFADFPIRDLVIKVLGDETLADQIVEKIGKVDYSVPYTAQMTEDMTGVNMTFTPEPLKLTLSSDSEGGEPENYEEPASIEIEVEILAEGDGAYTIDSKNLGFRISAASVKLGGTELPTFEPFTLAFDLAKN